MFLGSGEEVLQEARRWLGKVSQLEARQAENQAEWGYLRSCTVQAWKDLCYGMWNAI